MKYSKKGNIDGAGPLLYIVVGVGITVMVIILIGTLTGTTYNLIEPKIEDIAGTVTNEQFTASNITAITLSENAINTGSISFYNTSNGLQFGVANFSINYADGTILATPYTSIVKTGWGINTSYTYGDSTITSSIKSGIKSGFASFESVGSYTPIVVMALIISVVIILVLSFANIGNNKGSGGAL